jgi:hypothetical protein
MPAEFIVPHRQLYRMGLVCQPFGEHFSLHPAPVPTAGTEPVRFGLSESSSGLAREPSSANLPAPDNTTSP